MNQSHTFRFKRFLLPLAICCLLLLPAARVSGCHLSSFSITSVFPSGLDTMITGTLCIGGGRTGVNTGANGDTRTIAFVFEGGPPGFNVLAFTPSQITGVPTNCSMPGINIGPQGPPFNSSGTIMYVDPGYYGVPPCVTQPYACITSTALCGNVGQNCFTWSILVNRLADSLCVYGVEAGGNVAFGCPCAVMGSPLRLGAPLSVVWGDVVAEVEGDLVDISWRTLQENVEGTFHLERAFGDGGFEEVLSAPSNGSAHQPTNYSATLPLDDARGEMRYRIRFEDQDGRSDYSSIVSVRLPEAGMVTVDALWPNPVRNMVNARFSMIREAVAEWSVIDSEGKVCARQAEVRPGGETTLHFDMTGLRPGVYYFQVKVEGEMVTRKFVKMR